MPVSEWEEKEHLERSCFFRVDPVLLCADVDFDSGDITFECYFLSEKNPESFSKVNSNSSVINFTSFKQ